MISSSLYFLTLYKLLMLHSVVDNLRTYYVKRFLNKGIHDVCSFHSKSTIPAYSDMLNTCASGVLICSTVSFRGVGTIGLSHLPLVTY